MKSLRVLVAMVFLAIVGYSGGASGQTLTTLHSFSGDDGFIPDARLVQANNGSFYGVTAAGGSSDRGVVFKISPGGAFTVLHDFTGGADGGIPTGLVKGRFNRFYGTTYVGGSNPFCPGCGTVFKIHSAGRLTTLFSFFGDGDGANPLGGLVLGSDREFYGTTLGGPLSVYGTVYKITAKGDVTPLWQFSGDKDGGAPVAPPVEGSDGDFYGTTLGGPHSLNGTIFKITPAGELTPLYIFTGGSDGGGPSGLVLGSDGNFYGTTAYGGTNVNSGFGTVFKMSPAGTLTTLHRFSGADGRTPFAELVQGSDGYFYGTTEAGGTSDHGTVFRINSAGTFTTLHDFGGGPDGSTPEGPVVQGRDANLRTSLTPWQKQVLQGPIVHGRNGNFYGTTAYGGTSTNCGSAGCGTVFKLSVPLGH
jgi:uncharacterized repeat protein (TIGR03803 family)